ncbi:LamB/YcsF family protein [Pseudobythopirellula maris]|uniref:LamB/YcsF family protein n=1 Tax=Pseudobythopirellula maris TaxID=2527991 RepID=A0A5C5ZN98_9BACT|nr:5-oxoprolinase subunit PxpA [Pseudobythopirellula maris]TWT88576.1 LamB/YcsF family protein [Pseudobythopirellula maris]
MADPLNKPGSRRTIDLNGDVGEGVGDDAALIPLLTSANLACGGHAGGAQAMSEAIACCLASGVAIGAHPGYEDRENFGRVAVAMSPAALEAMVLRQAAALQELAAKRGAAVAHLKPHGALYHTASIDAAAAGAVAEAAARLGPRTALVGPAGSELAHAAQIRGLPFVREAFADRAYNADGHLVPRSDPRGVITDNAHAIAQGLRLASAGEVQTVDRAIDGAAEGAVVRVPCDTLCVHGDHPGAIALAAQLRAALIHAGVELHTAGVHRG